MPLPYFEFTLKCQKKLAEFTRYYFKQFTCGKNVYVETIPIPAQLKEELDLELASLKLPPSGTFLGFKRKNEFNYHLDTMHIDANEFGDKVHVSIVIPVDNCVNTKMYWVDGNTSEKLETTADGSYFFKVFTRGDYQYVYPIEISSNPFITKVSIPHSATTRVDGTYRTTLTIRFRDNVLFEDIKQIYNNDTSA